MAVRRVAAVSYAPVCTQRFPAAIVSNAKADDKQCDTQLGGAHNSSRPPKSGASGRDQGAAPLRARSSLCASLMIVSEQSKTLRAVQKCTH